MRRLFGSESSVDSKFHQESFSKMKSKIQAGLIAVAIIILSLSGMAFVGGLAHFVWSTAEWGLVRRLVIIVTGVIPGAIVSIGFFIAAIRDVASMFKAPTNQEDGGKAP